MGMNRREVLVGAAVVGAVAGLERAGAGVVLGVPDLAQPMTTAGRVLGGFDREIRWYKGILNGLDTKLTRFAPPQRPVEYVQPRT
jgi:hypothetical protein